MTEPTTSSASTRIEIARDLVLRQLGATRVAGWCGVSKNTVYQWLLRGSEDEPFPLRHAMTVYDRARAEGLHFDIRSLAPAVPAGRV